jgi:hypothetical protein
VQDQAAGDEGTLTGWSFTIQARAGSASATHPSSIGGAPKAESSGAPTGAIDTVFTRSPVEFLPASNAPAGMASREQVRAMDNTPVATFTTPRATDRIIDRIFASGGVFEDNAGLHDLSLDEALLGSEE